MKYRLYTPAAPWPTLLAGTVLVALATPAAQAQTCCQPVQTYPMGSSPPAILTGLPAGAGMALPIGQGEKPQTPTTPQTPKKETPKEITETPTPQVQQPGMDQEQQAAGGSESVAVATPNVIGDFISFRVLRAPTGATALQAYNQALGVVTAVRAGTFKIAENENVRPQDRVFFNYNYYYDVNAADRPLGIPRADVHRETIGFEKTFMDGDASFGMRLPYLSKEGDGGVDFFDGFDDLAFILKFAFINNPQDGIVASGGLVGTAPTGRAIKIPGVAVPTTNGTVMVGKASDINPVVIAPWVGGLLRGDAAFVQAFSQIAAPFDARDATMWFNDIAMGYTVYRACDNDAFLTQLAPVFEVHVNTPLSHRGSFASVIGVPDWVTLVGGTHFEFCHRATLTLGAGAPVTGPKPYSMEAMCQFNWRF
jgi:hypothetical protein